MSTDSTELSPCCVSAEWRTNVILEFAQKAQEAQRQFDVSVVSANSGGLVVRSRNLKGNVAMLHP